MKKLSVNAKAGGWALKHIYCLLVFFATTALAQREQKVADESKDRSTAFKRQCVSDFKKNPKAALIRPAFAEIARIDLRVIEAQRAFDGEIAGVNEAEKATSDLLHSERTLGELIVVFAMIQYAISVRTGVELGLARAGDGKSLFDTESCGVALRNALAEEKAPPYFNECGMKKANSAF